MKDSRDFDHYDVRIKKYSTGKIEIRHYSKVFEKLKDGVEYSDYLTPFQKNWRDKQLGLNSNQGRVSADDSEFKEISRRSLIRTRNTLIDYAIQNKDCWSSFITLTFAENITDLTLANKLFRNSILRAKKRLKDEYDHDLMYLCVPEYQMRGAVHYHLLTNINCGSSLIPQREMKPVFNKKNKSMKMLEFYDLNFWEYGYSTAFDIKNSVDENFNIALYMTKYLYKDIDNRLFGRNKIMKSHNLKKPDLYFLMFESDEYKKTMEYIKKRCDFVSSYSASKIDETDFITPFENYTFQERND